MANIERPLERLIFASRWLLAPFFVGLVLAILVLLAKFGQELWYLLGAAFQPGEAEVVLSVLTLVDIALVASLLLIIIFSGYENFVSKLDIGEHTDRPGWMGKVDFADLKIKLIASIAAISAIELLKAFVNVRELTDAQLAWKVGIHLTFVASGVLFAVMNRITEGSEGKH